MYNDSLLVAPLKAIHTIKKNKEEILQVGKLEVPLGKVEFRWANDVSLNGLGLFSRSKLMFHILRKLRHSRFDCSEGRYTL